MATIMKNPKQSSPSSCSLSLPSQQEAAPPTSFTAMRDTDDPILSRIVTFGTRAGSPCRLPVLDLTFTAAVFALHETLSPPPPPPPLSSAALAPPPNTRLQKTLPNLATAPSVEGNQGTPPPPPPPPRPLIPQTSQPPPASPPFAQAIVQAYN